MSAHRHHRLIAAAAVVVGLALPSAATAAPYEQVSRATGPAGASTQRTAASPVAIGDVGRFAGYQASSMVYIRDIRTNVTTTLGTVSEVSIAGFDQSERFAVITRRTPTVDRLVALPLPVGSGAERVIYTSPGTGISDAHLSIDGSTVVLSDTAAQQLRSIDVASGAVTTLSPSIPEFGWGLGAFSVSANGRTVLAVDLKNGDRTVFRRGPSGVTTESVVVGGMLAPDGSATVAVTTFGQGNFAVVRDPLGPEPWTSTPFTPPAPSPGPGGLAARWVSTDGKRLVIVRSEPEAYDGYPSFQVDTSTGAVSSFGGRFRSSVAGTPGKYVPGYGQGTMLSPSGRMALLPVSGQLVIADLSGAHLIGANEPLSADVFFNFWVSQRCSTSLFQPPKFFGTQTLKVRRPADWVAMPLRYDVKMYADNTLLKSGSPVNGETYTVNWAGKPRFHRAQVSVTLSSGQIVSTTWSLNGGFYGACYQ
ncbi:MAG: hypothetical protein JHD16_14975 [Solirubrobacteraceae bacterium]|nr:hypothetical protein [Solirubrobacteraceae bacterium]